MISLKTLLILAALLLAVSAHPSIETEIHEIKVVEEKDMEVKNEGDIEVIDVDDMETVSRAPREKALFAVQKVEAGFARTTNVGLTVQKGTYGIIKFRIRLKAVTAEALALKAALFAKKLTKAQKKQLTKITEGYDGGIDVPWLKFLGIDLKKGASRKDLIKIREKSVALDKLAILAKLLLKETIVQTIEVKGVLKAKGVSFIPTTVFSFIRIAKVYFEDGSKLLVLSDHPGDVATATKDGGKVVPHDVKDLEIL